MTTVRSQTSNKSHIIRPGQVIERSRSLRGFFPTSVEGHVPELVVPVSVDSDENVPREKDDEAEEVDEPVDPVPGVIWGLVEITLQRFFRTRQLELGDRGIFFAQRHG